MAGIKRKLVMKVQFIILFLTAFSGFLSAYVYASSSADLREADRLYHKGRYDEALKLYDKALAARPESDIINFNRGTALYKKGRYKDAIASFQKALVSDNKKIEAAADYNLGNCYYKLGEAAEHHQDITAALENYRMARQYYRRAIDMNTLDRDAKYNYELVDRKIDILKRKLKNMPSSGRPRKESPSSRKKQGKTGTQQNKKEGSKETKKMNPKAQPEKKAGRGEKKQGALKGSRPNVSSEKKSEGKPKRMSEEEAHMLIDGFPEKMFPFAKEKEQRRNYPEVINDW